MTLFFAGKILRPSIRNGDLPVDEPRRSIMKFLIDSLWSDDPGNRPSFFQIKALLQTVAPLKGDEKEKRAFLLEKETEELERCIAQETRLINREQERIHEWLNRSLPPHVYSQVQGGKEFSALPIDTVSVAAFQIANFQNIVDASSAEELVCVVDYLMKSFQAMAAQHRLELTEIEVISDLVVIGKMLTS